MYYYMKYKHRYYWHVWENVEKELKLHFSNLINEGICPTTSMMQLAGVNSKVWSKSLYGGIKGIFSERWTLCFKLLIDIVVELIKLVRIIWFPRTLNFVNFL